MRTLFLLFIGLFAATAVQAQVAAPALNPFLTDNPAVLPFTGPSLIGGFVEDGSTTDELDVNSDGVLDTTAESEEEFAAGQLRAVGDLFSVALLYGQGEETDAGGATTDLEGSEALFAARLGDAFAVGVGYAKLEATNAAAPDDSIEITVTAGGAVLRLGDAFYLGGTVGNLNFVTIQDFGLDAPTSVDEDARTASFGIGYSTRGADGGFHVELYTEQEDGPDLSGSGTTGGLPASFTLSEESETMGATLEVLLGSILLGASIADEDTTRDVTFTISGFGTFTGTSTEEEQTRAVAVGYVPEQGLTIVLSREVSEETVSNSPETSEETLTTVAIGWLF